MAGHTTAVRRADGDIFMLLPSATEIIMVLLTINLLNVIGECDVVRAPE